MSSATASPLESTSSPTPSSCADNAAFPARNGLSGVQFVSASTGWAVGGSGVLATTDGGVHWVEQYRAGAPELQSVDTVDAQHAWAVGGDVLLATTDGRHWAPLTEPCPLLRSVHFVDVAHGYGVAGGDQFGAGGVLLTTSDGGRSWWPSAAPADVQSVCFDPQGNGWLGAGGRIYGFVHGSWTVRERGYAAHTDGGGVPVVELGCAGHGAAWAEIIGPGVGMSQQPHVGYHTFGSTWSPIFSEQYHLGPPEVATSTNSPGSYAGPFSAISAGDAAFVDICRACDPAAMAPIVFATNGGAQLHAPSGTGSVGGITDPTGASFVSTAQGWVVGTLTMYEQKPVTSTTVIAHTADGGQSWTTPYSAAQPDVTP